MEKNQRNLHSSYIEKKNNDEYEFEFQQLSGSIFLTIMAEYFCRENTGQEEVDEIDAFNLFCAITSIKHH